MRYPAWFLGSLALVFAAGSFSGVAADSYVSPITGESSTLTIDVVPLSAEVRLDGVSLGTAHDLISQAVAVTPGTFQNFRSTPQKQPMPNMACSVPAGNGGWSRAPFT